MLPLKDITRIQDSGAIQMNHGKATASMLLAMPPDDEVYFCLCSNLGFPIFCRVHGFSRVQLPQNLPKYPQPQFRVALAQVQAPNHAA